VNRADQPSKLNVPGNVLHALVSFAGGRTVVEQQQDAGGQLDQEQKQRHSPEQIPGAVPVHGHSLFAEGRQRLLYIEALLDPSLNSDYTVHDYAACFRLT
jgi:hypothetical protein